MNHANDASCREALRRLVDFWKVHRRFDANMKDLARHAGVSRDTVYRWLGGRAVPKPEKARRIDEWLSRRG
ncbi:MAG: helix-turn-helix transcriptional regulator [bacterium]|nr:helix-turn-helix transcriptional regulator [bacterium]